MGFFSFGRPEATDVLRDGVTYRGHIVGIRVSYTREEPATRIDDYAVAIATPAGMQIFGVRQRLQPDDHVRLGLPVTLRVMGKSALIDWAATCEALGSVGETLTDGWRPLKEAPHEGVVDRVLDLERAQRKGEPARVSITAVKRHASPAAAPVLDLDLMVRNGASGSYPLLLEHVAIPFYARHLCEQGMELPAYVRPNRVDLDWPTAARNFMAIEAARRG